MDEASRGNGRGAQVRLGDLVVVVVGSAYVLDVVRRARAAWGGGMPDTNYALGLVTLTLGVGLFLILAGRWFRDVRDRGREGRAWALGWRIMVLGGLAWSVTEVASCLQVGRAELWGDRRIMRLNVVPLVGTLGLIGSILMAAPIRRRLGTPTNRGWKSWPMVLLLTLASLVFVAEAHGVIPYLILMALEAVHHALRNAPLVARPTVFERLDVAGLESIPGLLGCFLTAVWLDDDLRGATSDPVGARRPRSRFGVIVRASTVVLAGGGALFVVHHSIPKLDPSLGEAIATMFSPSTVATIVVGFSALAAGIAARSAAHLADDGEPIDPPASPFQGLGPWPGRIFKTIVALAAIELTIAAIQVIRKDYEDHWYVPIPFHAWAAMVQAPAYWLGLPRGTSSFDLLLYQPGVGLIAVASAWLFYRMIRLFVSSASAKAAPLDLLAGDPLARGRFLGWWLGLTTLMLASLPLLAVAGVTLTHYWILWTTK